MSRKTRGALVGPSGPLADRNAWRLIEWGKRPLALLLSGMVFAAMLGLSQPIGAESPDQLSGQSRGDLRAAPSASVQTSVAGRSTPLADDYSVLHNFAASKDAAEPNPAVANEPIIPDDVHHSALRSSAHPTLTAGLLSASDDYAALHDFAASKDAAEPNAAAADEPNIPNDVYHSALRSSAHRGMIAVPASAADDYAVLHDFAESNAAMASNLIVADAGVSATRPIGGDGADSARVDFGLPATAAESNLVVAQAAKPVPKIKKPSADAGDAYAKGDPQTCMGCHGQDRHVVAFLKSPMAAKGDPRTPMAQGGCQSCHGPSAAHVASRSKGGDVEPAVVFDGPHAAPVEDLNAICLGCHQTAQRINWQGSKMERAGVACTSCHTVMASEDPVRVKKTQPDVCFGCHAEQRAQSFQYSHHPVREGLVACTDCHNPHGSPGPFALKEFTVNQTCYNCHADKRGPMLWEHQPVREDCTNCHTPHGSVEARLMKENMGFMCSSCHSAVSNNSGGAFGGGHALLTNLQGKAIFNSALGNQRLCLNCHSQIHGSNSPNGTYFFR